ncbi:hypothetical protein BDR07DRAFT_118154 [Suillus spraguei]|nr:hypothetical protein BDR07DRAFT_118154 [Suillus spraguei]
MSRFPSSIPRTIYCRVSGAYSIQGRTGDMAVLYHSPSACHPSQGRSALPYLVVRQTTTLSASFHLSTTSVPFCVYRIHFILFFTLSYSLNSLSTIWFVVGRFLAFSVPYPHRANRFFVLLLSLSFAHCPRIHPRHCCSNHSTTSNFVYNYICNLKGSMGVSIILVARSFLARMESAPDSIRWDVHQNRGEAYLLHSKI